jgi:phosphoribosylamine--glycine ligase
MANILILDPDCVGLDFALRCQEHGHQAKLFLRKAKDGSRDRTGDGLVEKVSDWEKWARWADLIFPTVNSLYMDKLDALRAYGYPVFGPSKASADLEINRKLGMDVFAENGIEVPPYKMFATLDACEAYCWKHGNERWVFKTLGSDDDKSMSYVAKDAADMITTIRRWKKNGVKLKGACMLQTFIAGVEVGVSAWIGSDGFLKPRGENFEHKKLMSGNFGPNTGEMGTVMWYTDKSKLSKVVLDPLERYLLKVGHRGDVDVNCIVDEKGKAWPLEFTTRAGWPAFFIMCAQHAEPVKWMIDALHGKDTLQCSMDAFVGCVMAQPPFPNKGGDKSSAIGNPILGITMDNWPNIHLAQAMLGKGVDMQGDKPVEKDMLLTSGEYPMVITGSGKTIKAARKRAYQICSEISVPNKMVRDDIGESEDKLAELQKHGYATGVK